MKPVRLSCSLLCTALLTLALALPAAAADWQEIYTEDEVVVSKMDVEGSRFVAFKGDTVYDAPLSKVLYVLLDNEHRTEWVGRLYTNHIVEQTTPFDYVLYQAFELPAIFANRDYVYHGVATRDADSGVVKLKMSSVEHPDAPETVGVRATLVNSQYVLTPVSDDKTRVEVEIMTDPQGRMPAWLVNMIQRSWPLDTLNGVRRQLDKPYTLAHALPGEPDARVAARDEVETDAIEAAPSDDEAPTVEEGTELAADEQSAD